MAIQDVADAKRRKLVGCDHFVRHNPMSDRFEMKRFHHLEFYAVDATTTAKRLQAGLGMTLVAKSDLSTNNSTCVSQVIQSNDITFVITAPQAPHLVQEASQCPLPGYSGEAAFEFIKRHGLAVRAIGISVGDAREAHRISIENGGISVSEPTTLTDQATGKCTVVAEVKAYGDVVLRYVSGEFRGPFLPNYAAVDAPRHCYGLQRMDHCVGNAPSLFEVTDYLSKMTGFHEFAEFTAEDIGTVDSGLNSMVLANNSEFVLLPINEPTFGTRRKSQIQTYLEHNEGAGVQHLALKTDDIFSTLRQMRNVTDGGGLDFMARTSSDYYRKLPDKIGDALTPKQYKEAEELGILVDRDDQGVLLQIFTRPIGDRPTFFFEIIQRIGCEHQKEIAMPEGGVVEVVEQAGGCGGFGKGNFSELFKSIEQQFESEFRD